MSDHWLHIAPRDSNSPIVPTHDQVRETPRPSSPPLVSHIPFQFTVLYVVRSPLLSLILFYLHAQDEGIDNCLCGSAFRSVDHPRRTNDDRPFQTLRHRLA